MSEPASGLGAPRKVLLATDLSARGDRALERAVAVASGQNAQLLIVHAFEEVEETTLTYRVPSAPSWRRPPDALAIMKQRIRQSLRADLAGMADHSSLYIEAGDPAEVIERIATSESVDLIITGIAREGLFATRPVILGRTVEQLLRRMPVPVLIVRNRAYAAYQHIVVATDFSAPSAHALQMALRFFPAQPLYLLHASEAPYPTFAPDPDRHAEGYREIRSTEIQEFLASIYLPPEDRSRVVPLIEPGPVREIVREYVQVRGADLVVLGTRGRGAVLEALLGSSAKSILATLPCDALVVQGPRQ